MIWMRIGFTFALFWTLVLAPLRLWLEDDPTFGPITAVLCFGPVALALAAGVVFLLIFIWTEP